MPTQNSYITTSSQIMEQLSINLRAQANIYYASANSWDNVSGNIIFNQISPPISLEFYETKEEVEEFII